MTAARFLFSIRVFACYTCHNNGFVHFRDVHFGADLMRQVFRAVLCVLALMQPVHAQDAASTKITFGGLKGDPSQPVTVTAQELTMDEAAGTAVFVGDVLVVQGLMRLSADSIEVIYDEDRTRIKRLNATGNVILVNAEDAAQSQAAEYIIDDGQVTMLGDVVLTQGPATFTAAKLVADLVSGYGQLTGGVRSTFTPAAGAAP